MTELKIWRPGSLKENQKKRPAELLLEPAYWAAGGMDGVQFSVDGLRGNEHHFYPLDNAETGDLIRNQFERLARQLGGAAMLPLLAQLSQIAAKNHKAGETA